MILVLLCLLYFDFDAEFLCLFRGSKFISFFHLNIVFAGPLKFQYSEILKSADRLKEYL